MRDELTGAGEGEVGRFRECSRQTWFRRMRRMWRAMNALGFAGSSMSLKRWFWLVFELHVNI